MHRGQYSMTVKVMKELVSTNKYSKEELIYFLKLIIKIIQPADPILYYKILAETGIQRHNSLLKDWDKSIENAQYPAKILMRVH